MNRSRSTPAVILKNNRVGEIHKGIVMLTPDDGLVSAIAHGAYSQKGKLRGTTNLFCTGTAYIYTDPVRNSIKVTDMDVQHFFSGIREDLLRFYTASLWAESLLKTYAGGGESHRLFALLVESLEELDRRNSAEARKISIQYVWRFLEISGTQPDLDHCAVTGEFLEPRQPAYYSPRHQGFCSPEHGTDDMARWQPDALAYMRHTGTIPFPEALTVIPPAEATSRIKRVLYQILQEHVETPLNSLRSGSAIL